MNVEIAPSTITPLYRVRPGAAVTITFKLDGQAVCASAYQLLSATPLGATVRVREDIYHLLTNNSLDVELTIGDQTLKLADAVIEALGEEDHAHLIYISWENPPDKSRIQKDRPLRWPCDRQLAPLCVITNPYELYGQKCFKVENLSRVGLQLLTTQPPGLLIPGLRLPGVVQFPGLGPEPVTLELRWLRPNSSSAQQEFYLGARIIEAAPSYGASAGQYLFQHISGIAAAEVRSAGLLVPSVASGVTYEFAQSSEDYRDVLELRMKTYPWVQLSSQAIEPEEMGDIYDTRANILIARHQGKCVGSLRIVFHRPGDMLEMLEHVENAPVPDWFPQNEDLVEVTRICVDHNYRKGDLLLGMFKQVLLVMLQSNKWWLVGGSEEGLLPYYKALGAKVTGLEYQWARGGMTTAVSVLTINLADYLNQVDVSQAAWNLLAPDVIAFAQNHQIPIKPQPQP